MKSKVWWWINKKPASRSRTYTSVLFPGFLAGIGIFGVLLIITYGYWLLATIIGVLMILTLLLSYRLDRRDGYVVALHEVYLKKRERIGKELGKIK